MENAVVLHNFFGRGIVVEKREKTIRVRFDREDAGEKSFVYPDAFSSYLRFEDPSLQAEVCATLDAIRRRAEEDAAEREAARAALMEQEKQHQKELAAARRKATARASARKKAE